MSALSAQGAAKLFQQTVCYVDRVHVRLAVQLDANSLAHIKKLAGKFHHRNIWQRYKDPTVQILHICQPSRQCLQLLESIARGRYYISYLEVALDFLTKDTFVACRLRDFFYRHLSVVHHRARRLSGTQHVIYWSGQRKTPNSFALYSSRPSKVTGGPCCHLETRTRSKRAVADLGVRVLSDLLVLDRHNFWRKKMRLQKVDHTKLGLSWAGLSRHAGRIHRIKGSDLVLQIDLRFGGQMARLAHYNEVGFDGDGPLAGFAVAPVQAVIDFAHKYERNIRRALIRIDPTPFLPPPGPIVM